MIFICCRGGNKLVPELLKMSGWFYGVRHDTKPYDSVYFLDINWKRYDWNDYISKVKRYKPVMALALDYIHPCQKNLLLERIDELYTASVSQVLACPKFDGAVYDIPNNVVVAVSVPTQYAGFLPNPQELVNRKVHLLGGSPDQWKFLIINKYNQSDIISLDGNVMFMKSYFGQYFLNGKWIEQKNKFSSEYLVRMSLSNIKDYMFNKNNFFDLRKKRIRILA